jgi:predicted nuclease of predicted toxin-antitoxin system
MTFSDFKLLADENIQSGIVEYLRSLDFDVKDVKEEQLAGSTDEFLLNLAIEDKRVIVTHDSDFGNIVYRGNIAFTGITYLRPGHFQPSFTEQTIDAILEANPELSPPFILVAENKGDSVKIRIRHF